MADATTAPPAMMNPAQTPALASERIPPKRLFAFLIMVFGMFMSILDIQIVSALNEIQAGLSASQSEVSWVQTSYLIAEVFTIPLSGFMSRALGTKRFQQNFPEVPVTLVSTGQTFSAVASERLGGAA